MPELPEVEAARRLLERGCVGKIIKKAVVADDDKVFEVSPEGVQRALEGRRVVAIHRKGKYLWLELDNADGPWPLLHFGMTGGIVVQKMGFTKYKRIHLESDPDEWPPRFTKLELDLEGGAKLAFVDARRFARVKLMVNPQNQEPLSRLGFDVLNELPSVADFSASVRKRVARAPGLKIKALLLDQEFCSGIGNWVGDEVLYQARIHPEQAAASLDDTALGALHAAIRSVVGQAVEVEADSDRFPRDWLFHYRWTNKKPSSINGHKIDFVTVGSRTSAFVPALQKLDGNGEGSSGGGGGGGGRGKASGSAGGKRGSRGSSKRGKKAGGPAGSESEDNEDDQEHVEAEEVEEADSDGDGATVATATRSQRTAAAKLPSNAKAAGKADRKAGGGKKGPGKSGEAARVDSDAEEEDKADPPSEGSEEAEEDDGAEDSDYSEEERGPGKKRARRTTRAAAPAKKRAKAATASAKAKAKAKRPEAPRSRKARA